MPNIILDESTGTLTLTNGRLELTIDTRPAYNPRGLRDITSGQTFADSDYIWWDLEPAALTEPPVLTAGPDAGQTVSFRLKKGGLALEQTFTLPGDEDNVLIERIRISN